MAMILCLISGFFSGQCWCSGRIWKVDDDRVQYPSANYTSIQPAVDAASNGDTIQVYPGTYSTPVTVGKTLTLLGAQQGRDARTRRTTPAQESVIVAGGTFLLAANNIVMDGFSVVVVESGGFQFGSIETSTAFSGYLIANNIMDAERTRPLYTGNNGQRQMVVRRNLFRGPFAITARGPTHNLLVDENLFLGGDLWFYGGEHSDLWITKNKWTQGGRIMIEGAQEPALNPLQGASILLNEFNGSYYAAMFFRNVEDVLVKGNILRGSGGTGVDTGIRILQRNTNLRLENNRITGFPGSGIRVGSDPTGDDSDFFPLPGSGVHAINNEVESNGAGIVLEYAENNILENNNVEDNQAGGILARIYTSNNLILSNEVRGNGPPDCQDINIASQTSSTANTWLENEGSTSFPSRLCLDNLSLFQLGPNLLRNSSLTLGSGGWPNDWTPDAYLFSAGLFGWNQAEGSVRIQIPSPAGPPNDARWIQSVAVEPYTDYVLEALVKTEDVTHSLQAVDAGANLSILEPFFLPFDHSSGLIGTHSYTRAALWFNSGAQTSVTAALRLGIYSGTTTGQAWFKAPSLRKVLAQ
jgi:parallel beta-helix repeat protein